MITGYTDLQLETPFLARFIEAYRVGHPTLQAYLVLPVLIGDALRCQAPLRSEYLQGFVLDQ